MRGIRRVVSIILYVVAGMFLLSCAMMSFVVTEPDLPKASVTGLMAALSLVPLAIGAVISPGPRGREVGLVLLVAAGWVTFTAVTFAILLMDDGFMAMMPPDTQQSFRKFRDLEVGAAFTLAIGGAGFWLVRRNDGTAAE